MISYSSYKLISGGVCRHCNKPYLEWVNQQGWVCKQCKFVYLIDKVRKCVLEPDCQSDT